ncbi:MAG: UdgX family uracil-DNA binding protein [Alphaproteobacteria bacterium]|nr:UdgX family uracil-DNA binding protein [Alphaproteobacteria bacterium]
MTLQICLPEIGTDRAWRDRARQLLAQGVPPQDVLWSRGALPERDLFGQPASLATDAAVTVPRVFLGLAGAVVWHRDPQRFARLYGFLWRLKDAPGLITDRGDAPLSKLHAMAKQVRRDTHKMTAFLRFREVDGTGPRRRFAAWFEPSNYIMEPAAPFFAKRFGDMDWTIFTPHLTADFTAGTVSFCAGRDKPNLPEDATEDLWRTYFRNIFNPARLKVQAMQSEMPKKYWRNLPEAELIPDLIAGAQARAQKMAEAAPTLPPLRAGRIRAALDAKTPQPEPPEGHDAFKVALQACRRCPLWKNATQAVPGEGPLDADLMVVGEQPGDHEDLTGRPFVGPAGQLFDRIAAEAGLDRARAYVTNAVKHFKFAPRGKRRIHQNPSAGEVQHCRWWLDHERQLVRPRLIVALGGSAAGALTGNRKGLLDRRGTTERAPDGTPVLITFHPSCILRLTGAERSAAAAQLRQDLQRAAQIIGARAAAPAPQGTEGARAP